MAEEKKIFVGGMDSDTESRLLQEGFDRYRLNVRALSSDGSNIGSIELVLGNSLVTFTLPSGNCRCVGSVEDKTNFKNYYWVWNDLGNDSILEYDQQANTVALVLQSTVLKLNPEYLITGAFVLEGLLYWTDNNQEPRKINIEKAKNNGYPTPFIEDFIYRIKAYPACDPVVAYSDDTTKNVNYLENHLFQFRSRWIYDDYEKSAWSPISIPPLPNTVCGQNSNPGLNNNILVTTDTGNGIVTKIEIAARKGNTGDFFSIVVLDKSALGILNDTTYTYPFYNEKNYNFVDIQESVKLFDRVPKKEKALDLIAGNRVADGNIVEGFNPVTPDIDLSLTFAIDPNTSTYTISGSVYIHNIFTVNYSYMVNQPIHDFNDGNGYVFGGYGPGLGSIGLVNTVGTSYKQTIPLGGFVFYLAGTPYYGVSKQVIGTAGTGSVQDGNNVYSSDTYGNKNDVRDEINAGACYSTFTISGVPAGTYVLRVADHKTTQADLDNPSRLYQSTSTFAVNVGGSADTEHIVTITNANVTVGTSIIADLTNPSILFDATAISGYVTDADIQPSPTSASGLLSDTRIELASVIMNQAGGNYNNTQTLSNKLANWPTGALVSDHNGFFFFAIANFFNPTMTLSGVQSGITNVSAFTKYKSDGSTFTGVNGAKLEETIMRSTNQGAFDNARTIINGNIQTSAGVGIQGISVVIGHGKVDTTEGGITSGNYSVIVYSNITSTSRAENIYFAVSDNCLASFAPAYDYFNFSIVAAPTGQSSFVSAYGGQYNYTTNCTTSNIIAQVLSGSASDVAWKRGGIYQLGIIYQDHGGRLGTTNTNDALFTTPKGLKLVIPFYTEIDPNTGSIYAESRPIIDWTIKHQPPIWATHWQLVMTQNSAVNSFLQWTAKTVVYTDDNRVPVGNYTQGTKIGLGIISISDFHTTFNDSQVSYSFTEGDRVRFIKNANGNFFNQYIDLKIRDYDPSGIIYVENNSSVGQIPAGSLFEIYTPKLKTDNQIYFEIGQCYEVGDPGTGSQYHKGETQDQDPNNLSGVPATGALSSGDTYYRLRAIPYATGIKNWYIEDASFSDFYKSKIANVGRPNKVDPDASEVHRPTTIYYTQPYIPETKINGLSSIFDLSFESYERGNGSIQKLFAFGQGLTVYQEIKVGQIQIDSIIYNDNQGNQTVGSSEQVLSKQMIYYKGNYGIGLNPESFAQYAGTQYFVDPNHGVVVRISNDGMTPISEYKMHNFFSDKIKEAADSARPINIFGVYDQKFSEYIIAFQNAYIVGRTIPPTLTPATVAFNETNNLWSTFYSYEPEFMCASNTGIVTFDHGNIYLHNSNSITNNFYGVQSVSEVWITSNGEPSKVKVFQALSQEADTVWEPYSITTPATATYPLGQSSSLLTTDFESIEGNWYSNLLFDALTPNVTYPLIEGDPLRGTSMLIKLRNSDTTFSKAYAFNVMWVPSERSDK